jgi:hypothetical protein
LHFDDPESQANQLTGISKNNLLFSRMFIGA